MTAGVRLFPAFCFQPFGLCARVKMMIRMATGPRRHTPSSCNASNVGDYCASSHASEANEVWTLEPRVLALVSILILSLGFF